MGRGERPGGGGEKARKGGSTKGVRAKKKVAEDPLWEDGRSVGEGKGVD